MRKILITFGGAAYDKTVIHTVKRSPGFGVDEVKVYDDAWLLRTQFYRDNIRWWHRRDTKYNAGNRGFGWFIWKPYVILHALAQCEPGDIVLYIDGDTYPIADLSPLYQECERIGGIMLFEEMGCEHQHWCKRDTFIVMGMDETRYRTEPNVTGFGHLQHAAARFMLFQKQYGHVRCDLGSCSECFLKEWQKYCLNDRANTFDPSVLAPEYPELKEPRCEQAILTNLAHKYGHRLYRTPDQGGATQPWDQEIYPQVFIQEDCDHARRLDFSGSRYRNVK